MTMKRTALILSFLLLALLLTACRSNPAADPTEPPETQPPAQTTAPAEPTTVPTTEATEPPTEAPTFPSAPPILGNFTQEDMDLFADLFRHKQAEDGSWPVNYYNLMLSATFASPEEVDLRRMFYDQDTDEAGELTEAEKKFLATQEQIALQLDVIRVSRKKMDSVLRSHLGLGLDEVNGVGLDRMAYFPDTGCYYSSHGDVGLVLVNILGGTWLEDGTAEVYYNDSLQDMIVTLRRDGDRYLVISNVPMTNSFTQEDMDAFTQVLTQAEGTVNYYNRFLGMTFDPMYVDLYELFCTPVSGEAAELSAEEKTFLATQDRIDLSKPVMRLTENDINTLLKQYMNQQLHNTEGVGLEKFVRYQDAYYRNYTDPGAVSFKVTGGTWLRNGNVEVCFSLADGTLSTITLRQSDSGSYYVIKCELGASGK